MTDADRRFADLVTASLINRALLAFAALLLLMAVLALSHIKPWGFARPPAEACRPAGQRVTPQTQHIPQCPAVERRKETT